MKSNPFPISKETIQSNPSRNILQTANEGTPKSNSEFSYAYSTSLPYLSPQKELTQLEHLLLKKEKRLEEKDEELNEMMLSANEERDVLSLEKLSIERKNKELETRIRALQEKESQLKVSSDKFSLDKKRLEEEKSNIMQLRSKIEANFIESEKIRALNIVTQENLQRDLKKFEVDCKVFEEKVQALNLKQDYIAKSNEDLERMRKRVQDEKESLTQEKNNLLKIKQQVSDERLKLFEEKKDIQSSSRKSLNMKIDFTERLTDKDLQHLYEKLRAQIGVFNQEVSEKEGKIRDQQKRLSFEQEEVAKKIFNLQRVQESLMRTKEEILVFYNEVLPGLEEVYNVMLEFLAKLKTKYSDAQSLYNRMSHSMSLVSSINGESSHIREKVFESQSYMKKSGDYKNLANNQVLEQSGAKEIMREAMAKIEAEQQAIAEDKEKLKIQFQQLELGVNTLNSKKVEMMKYKQELDKRANLLNIKENQLELNRLRKSNGSIG